MDVSGQETRKYAVLAGRIAAAADVSERAALHAWSTELLAIRAADRGDFAKAKAALGATLARESLFPVVRVLGRELKRVGWDERGLLMRFGLVFLALTLARRGGKLGLAVLGSALMVPVWMVLGDHGRLAQALQAATAADALPQAAAPEVP